MNSSDMSSEESGQSRAAVLINAARRSHFVAGIQKYEAKVKQEQMRRALQREKQTACIPLIEQQSLNWQRAESPQLPKTQARTDEFIDLSSENEHEKEGVSGCLMRVNYKDTERDLGLSKHDLSSRASSFGVDGAIALSGTARVQRKPTQHADMCSTMKPSAPLTVDISAIATSLKVKIKKANMAGLMQEHAFRCAKECLNSEKLMSKQTAYTLKTEFDRVYGPAWHCIVGRSFGSYVTHSVGGFIYFTMGKVSVLLFKTTVELVGHW